MGSDIVKKIDPRIEEDSWIVKKKEKFNFFRKNILKMKVLDFDGSDCQLDEIIKLTKKTKLSLNTSYCRFLSILKGQIEKNPIYEVGGEKKELLKKWIIEQRDIFKQN